MTKLKYFADASIAGALIYYVIGGLWYSPILFQKPWMATVGITPDRMQAAGPTCLVIGFFAALVLSFGTGAILRAAGVRSASAGMKHALALWLVFGATQINSFYELRPASLYCIQIGFSLVGMLAIGAIQGAGASRLNSVKTQQPEPTLTIVTT